MANTHFDFSVPLFLKGLGGLKKIVAVAADVAHGRPGGEKEVLGAQLAPDMFPFVRQVQIACDHAKGAVSRLTGKDAPRFEDTETTCAALHERIDKTIALVRACVPADFEGAESRRIELPYFSGSHMLGDAYLKEYVLPNFFFHLVTAYNIIRMLGGSLGKGDYLNGVPLIPNE